MLNENDRLESLKEIEQLLSKTLLKLPDLCNGGNTNSLHNAVDKIIEARFWAKFSLDDSFGRTPTGDTNAK